MIEEKISPEEIHRNIQEANILVHNNEFFWIRDVVNFPNTVTIDVIKSRENFQKRMVDEKVFKETRHRT